jgi:hypothetical protein
MSRPNPDFSLSPGNKSIAILFGRALYYRFITFKIFKIKKAGGYVMRSFFLNIYWATGHPPFLALANKCLLFIFSGRLWRFFGVDLDLLHGPAGCSSSSSNSIAISGYYCGNGDRPADGQPLLLSSPPAAQHYRHSNHTSQPFSSPNTI